MAKPVTFEAEAGKDRLIPNHDDGGRSSGSVVFGELRWVSHGASLGTWNTRGYAIRVMPDDRGLYRRVLEAAGVVPGEKRKVRISVECIGEPVKGVVAEAEAKCLQGEEE